MRNIVGLGVTVAAALGFVGCSSDGSMPRPEGSAGTPVAMAGTGGGAGAAGQGGTSAGSAGSAGAGGASVSELRLGDVLELVAGSGDIPYAIGPNPYGIVGGGFLARSAQGNTITVGTEPGKICIQGNLEEVPNGNYSQYWGVEFGFNLNQAAPPGGGGNGTPSDAGADASTDAAVAGDASAPAEVARPWLSGTVIGFSYVIEGPTINLVRFKALPAGFDRSLESSVFCKTVNATSGGVEDSLFGQMRQYCWGPDTNLMLPIGMGLDNISWQLPADVAPAGARPFDWCLRDLRPILND
jgi:hypothetical protein